MKKSYSAPTIVTLTISALITLLTSPSSFGESSNNDQEKCYGIAKAGRNDCSTKNSSCAGSSTKDRQLDAFVFLPKGLCDRIVGGHLQSTSSQSEPSKGN